MFASKQQMACCPSTSLSLFILSLSSLLISSHPLGHDSPSIFIPPYTKDWNLTARQDVCDRYRKYSDDEAAELRFALEGLQLNTAAIGGNFFLTNKNGEIREDYPGLAAVIMDEVASRGRFTWRQSYGFYTEPGDNHSWTELLLWTTDFYDVSMDWWTETLSRLKLGINFPEGWYDGSYILVGAKQEQEQRTINLWTWLEPFEGGVWVLILVTIVLSGAVYQFLEWLGSPQRHRGKRNHKTLGNDIFLSMLLFTQHFQFNPRTPASRIFAASMALWALLISSAYTANLASFFVIQNTPQLQVESIDDAIRLGLPLCVYDTAASALYVEQAYPKANLIKKKEELDVYKGVNEGECALAITSTSGFLEFEKDQRTNPDCRLIWIGRTINRVPAGFATRSDAGKFCTSLIHDVLNLHLVEMKADKFIDKAWDEHLRRNQDQDCSQDTTQDPVSTQRTVQEMAGTFLIHFFCSLAAIVLALGSKCMENYYRKKKDVDKARDLELEDDMFADEKPPINNISNFSMDSRSIDPSGDFDFQIGLQKQLLAMHRSGKALERDLRQRQDRLEQVMDEKLEAMMELLKQNQNSSFRRKRQST